MTDKSMTSRGFTGWHMLGIMCLFFGVIISVNLTMAYFAIGSWSGLVVKNSYVASQEFNEKAITGKEQAALQWEVILDYKNGEFSYQLTNNEGLAVEATHATAHFKRPVGDANDTTVELEKIADGHFKSKVELGEGAWIVEINAEAGLDDPYRQIRRFIIVNGEYK
ncbi:FixH family protein [Paenochrobactrum sp. BZR 588]|uniref:FixH family protein n=1 Tax=Paenochrobactrum TaxID=999488 RepID=UPI0035BC5058